MFYLFLVCKICVKDCIFQLLNSFNPIAIAVSVSKRIERMASWSGYIADTLPVVATVFPGAQQQLSCYKWETWASHFLYCAFLRAKAGAGDSIQYSSYSNLDYSRTSLIVSSKPSIISMPWWNDEWKWKWMTCLDFELFRSWQMSFSSMSGLVDRVAASDKRLPRVTCVPCWAPCCRVLRCVAGCARSYVVLAGPAPCCHWDHGAASWGQPRPGDQSSDAQHWAWSSHTSPPTTQPPHSLIYHLISIYSRYLLHMIYI